MQHELSTLRRNLTLFSLLLLLIGALPSPLLALEVAAKDWPQFCKNMYDPGATKILSSRQEAIQEELANIRKEFMEDFKKTFDSLYSGSVMQSPDSFSSINIEKMKKDREEFSKHYRAEKEKIIENIKSKEARRNELGLVSSQTKFASNGKEEGTIDATCGQSYYKGRTDNAVQGTYNKYIGIRFYGESVDGLRDELQKAREQKQIPAEGTAFEKALEGLKELEEKAKVAEQKYRETNKKYFEVRADYYDWYNSYGRLHRDLEVEKRKPLYEALYKQNADLESEYNAKLLEVRKEKKRLTDDPNVQTQAKEAIALLPDHDSLSQDKEAYCENKRLLDQLEGNKVSLDYLEKNARVLGSSDSFTKVIDACERICEKTPSEIIKSTGEGAKSVRISDVYYAYPTVKAMEELPDGKLCHSNPYITKYYEDEKIFSPEVYSKLTCYYDYLTKSLPCTRDLVEYKVKTGQELTQEELGKLQKDTLKLGQKSEKTSH